MTTLLLVLGLILPLNRFKCCYECNMGVVVKQETEKPGTKRNKTETASPRRVKGHRAACAQLIIVYTSCLQRKVDDAQESWSAKSSAIMGTGELFADSFAVIRMPFKPFSVCV